MTNNREEYDYLAIVNIFDVNTTIYKVIQNMAYTYKRVPQQDLAKEFIQIYNKNKYSSIHLYGDEPILEDISNEILKEINIAIKIN